MKMSNKKPPVSIIRNHETEHRKKRSLTQTTDLFFPQTPIPCAPDPFRAIDRGSPKLQPIILRSRCSPLMFEKKISIRIPEITSDGHIKSNKRILPALTPRPKLTKNSPEAKYSTFYRRFSEKAQIGQSYKIESLRLEESTQLDVSFGKNGSYLEQSSINPFNSR